MRTGSEQRACAWCGTDLSPMSIQQRLTETETTMTNIEKDIREIRNALDNGGLRRQTDYKMLVGVLLAVLTSLATFISNIADRW